MPRVREKPVWRLVKPKRTLRPSWSPHIITYGRDGQLLANVCCSLFPLVIRFQSLILGTGLSWQTQHIPTLLPVSNLFDLILNNEEWVDMKYATSRKERGLPSPLPSPSRAGWNVDRRVGAGTDILDYDMEAICRGWQPHGNK